MNQYTIIGRIGEGAHGIVFKAKHIEAPLLSIVLASPGWKPLVYCYNKRRMYTYGNYKRRRNIDSENRKSGEVVALKKVPLRRLDEGIPNTALREIKALQEIEDNPYIVKLREVFPQGTGFVLVFDYMLSDLSEVTRNSDSPLTQPQVKSYMIMLLKGIAFMHKNNIMHRDLKPANLLISASGHLKIADFGLARVFQNDEERLYSHQVATRWYRAPELLYGARKYNEGVDLWAVGCIFGELLNHSPLFPGENDIEQLCCVLRVLGTPNEGTWPEMVDLPDYNKISFSICQPVPFESILPDAPTDAIDLIEKILVYSSKKRLSATEALLHSYFFYPPLPAPRSELPRPERSKNFNAHAHRLYDTSPDVPIEESCIDPLFLYVGSKLSPMNNK